MLYDQFDAEAPGPTLIHLNLATGSDLRRAEECGHYLQVYIHGSFGNRRWSHDMVPTASVTELLFTWYHISVVFQGALRRRKTAQAFKVLRSFFDQQPIVLASLDPRLF
ncbi:hypothetical protein PG997_002526 [Apiospora hydei]|uniref:Uncharacterized protein n=1 Tax=Apiospora hydei TaxID=1337664 RepID=A0ABR1WWM2_9PEZI